MRTGVLVIALAMAGVAPVSQCAVAAGLPERPSLPSIVSLDGAASSHAFAASAYQQQPLDLKHVGYVEQEYLVSGEARVFDWKGSSVVELMRGPYTTRILLRRPVDDHRFNGTVIVEPMNPSADMDLPIMWAESHEQFVRDGAAWVGITIKPNTIGALKSFDPERYARLRMPNPQSDARCPTSDINAFSQPTTTTDESGLAWDILSEVGALLKSHSQANPLTRPAARLYMTGQSQTAGYARLYATLFSRTEVTDDGKPLYDAYLYSGSPPWQVPINQCRKDLPPGDPRLITGPAGVPVIELFAQGDLVSNIGTRRPDADRYPDMFRRYEVAGASHVDSWEMRSFPSSTDAERAHGRLTDNADGCSPKLLTPSDFPVRYSFDAAWRFLDIWVRQGRSPPHAPPLQLEPEGGQLPPDRMFVLDATGNAKGGVRTPAVDVPTARWVGARSGPFRCMFYGYGIPFDAATLRTLYGDHRQYTAKVRARAAELAVLGWLTREDAAASGRDAELTPGTPK